MKQLGWCDLLKSTINLQKKWLF